MSNEQSTEVKVCNRGEIRSRLNIEKSSTRSRGVNLYHKSYRGTEYTFDQQFLRMNYRSSNW